MLAESIFRFDPLICNIYIKYLRAAQDYIQFNLTVRVYYMYTASSLHVYIIRQLESSVQILQIRGSSWKIASTISHYCFGRQIVIDIIHDRMSQRINNSLLRNCATSCTSSNQIALIPATPAYLSNLIFNMRGNCAIKPRFQFRRKNSGIKIGEKRAPDSIEVFYTFHQAPCISRGWRFFSLVRPP